MFDILIIGSGPAGVHAARELSKNSKLRIGLLDVGHLPPDDRLIDKMKHDLNQSPDHYFSELIGNEYETLNNIRNEYLMPKLKAPLLRFVTRRQNGEPYRNQSSQNFLAIESFAQGGLANVWGAQTWAFTESEVADFPFQISELNPYYQDLSEHIGISGSADDDLKPFCGVNHALMPELKVGSLAQSIEQKYFKNRSRFNKAGIFLGRPRLAVLSQAHRGRRACTYSQMEFFKSQLPEIYNPAFTLKELLADKKIDYLSQHSVQSYEEDANGLVQVRGLNLSLKTEFTLSCRRLIVAAGTLNTSKIVLRSSAKKNSTLPILDNQISYIPLLNPLLIGKKFDSSGYGTALNIAIQDEEFKSPLFGTIYVTNGIFRSELIFDFPLSVQFKLKAARTMMPAMAVLQMWYPDSPRPENFLKLNDQGELEIRYQQKKPGRIEKKLCYQFLKSGLVTAAQLCQYPQAGNSFHYAGTLPMKAQPKEFETDPYGKLFGTKSVYVADGSVFPHLPSKNLTFTIMANSMRIAHHIGQNLKQE